MDVSKESSTIVKPIYDGENPSLTESIPLTVFDKVQFDSQVAIIYAYRSPTPSNSAIKYGLQKVLSEYREWAGRLGRDDKGNPVILLNDEGVKLVEASMGCTIDQALPLKPSATLLSLHPSLYGVKELVQVQLTRFTCGSLVVGFTSHHLVADGQSTSSFLVAWGQVCRGVDIKPCPLHDRTIFTPREPPKFEFEHRGVEYTKKLNKTTVLANDGDTEPLDNEVIVHKVHFTLDFLAKLQVSASSSNGINKPYSTFECLLAHLWRTITRAQELDGSEKTKIRISVNGRPRMNPRVPNEYFGNVVLWAFPTSNVDDLLRKPVSHAAKLIHDAVTKVNDKYFKSFIDFATHKVEEEDLISTADPNGLIMCPNLEVNSWLRFPFYDLDFGGGRPYIFMPSYFPIEGLMFLLPSYLGDGTIDAFVPLFKHNLASFKENCYSLD